ncbi:hypothetical protein IWW34DRAFT_672526 [Fusarium oxysporum f. sp. albedinis]|uniref:Uncharacterized protein n=4 Tax=Fusarium oxysporum TaxID=5507 RepID=A0A0D2YHS9_FUSOF|nr:hypothetical protein FOXG_15875 [Fusarium oxysporum f. sp. lycopersici 4287]EGU72274.1 hypothetical protein FOXB_17218 [Fusarium oxysporum f. sp. conglutinans Fo5176]EXL63831.1 hypothetical protein FOPG_19897 [Fusarium oxysporum f. sp. conglutinans race 2 54008]KAH7186925.1 hypothetical protein BKA60DRAFT_531657 [Fusarium oxysporum]KAH7462926.1 hypothetical protein FOMA001_g18364 [Fusarium oxysporum f. sp. matthiolae]KAI3573458.1 hypothetical protein IWW34DRAFT_672526 [Fusarium oxysporum f.
MVNILYPIALAMATLATAGPTGSGNVWWHTCGNCKCADSGSYTGFRGTSPCLPIDQSIRAVGLTRSGSKMTTCSIFTSDNCQGPVAQSVGVAGGTYACTAFNQNAKSIRCYYDV